MFADPLPPTALMPGSVDLVSEPSAVALWFSHTASSTPGFNPSLHSAPSLIPVLWPAQHALPACPLDVSLDGPKHSCPAHHLPLTPDLGPACSQERISSCLSSSAT